MKIEKKEDVVVKCMITVIPRMMGREYSLLSGGTWQNPYGNIILRNCLKHD